ncbi:hypothetical protein PEKONANI_02311 [Aeromonas jandaei]
MLLLQGAVLAAFAQIAADQMLMLAYHLNPIG